VEVDFYGLLDNMMPYVTQEEIGVALLKRACDAPGTTKRALQTAVAQARALVIEMGSTTPWLAATFQDARYVITDRVVNGAPVWEAENGQYFMWIGGAANCAAAAAAAATDPGRAFGVIYAAAPWGVQSPDVLAPTQLLSNEWRSSKYATLGPQFTSAVHIIDRRGSWSFVPDMRVTVVHGLAALTVDE